LDEFASASMVDQSLRFRLAVATWVCRHWCFAVSCVLASAYTKLRQEALALQYASLPAGHIAAAPPASAHYQQPRFLDEVASASMVDQPLRFLPRCHDLGLPPLVFRCILRPCSAYTKWCQEALALQYASLPEVHHSWHAPPCHDWTPAVRLLIVAPVDVATRALMQLYVPLAGPCSVLSCEVLPCHELVVMMTLVTTAWP
jgi:hypothetical protein